LLLGASLVASVIVAGSGAAPTASAGKGRCAGNFELTVLHNNDAESELIGDDEQGGVARFATVVEQAKQDAATDDRAAILVTSGDNFLASPEFTASLNDGTFYDAQAIDLLGYDALAIGNHEFDFGPDLLAGFVVESSSPPFVSANLDYSGEPALDTLFSDRVGRGGRGDRDNGQRTGQDRLFNSVIVKLGNEQVGIVGATTENLPFISSPRNVVVEMVLPAVQGEIDRLEQRNVDKIVLISHLQDVDGDIALATQLSGVDVMIAGGGDELLANPGDPLVPSQDADDIFGPYPIIATNADGADVPVVTTSGGYEYVGQLVVEFDCDGNVVGVDDDASLPRRVVSTDFPDGVVADPVMQAQVVDPVAAFVDTLAINVIAQTEVELDGRRSPGVRTMETNEGNLIADSQLWQAKQLAADFGVAEPDLAIQNGGGIRNDSIIATGANPGATQNITELDTFDMVPFANFVGVIPDIPRSQFKEILENTVSRTQPGDTPGGTGRFPQIAGFSMTWTGSGTAQVLNPDGTVATPGTRVQEVVLDDGTVLVTGGAVVAGPDINVSTIDFLARGGDEYPFRGAPFTVLGVSYQQALINYIVAPPADGGLGGFISQAQYPEGGEGRNTELP
jgi:5'-nucleotidase